LTNKNLANVVISAVASARIPAAKLVLEITESVFLQDTYSNLATLKKLHELGVQFSMDDFGTGYSSLGYLLSFPFSKIKIDRSFITGLPDKTECRAIVSAIVDLARNLNMRVIAEGVETAQQLEQVRNLGCTDMQGYLFSPARPAAEIHELFLPKAKDAACVVSQVA
jgi:EAL domain-containing protein (putative c-di-GMP-specific phosphodiesterase class I)